MSTLTNFNKFTATFLTTLMELTERLTFVIKLQWFSMIEELL